MPALFDFAPLSYKGGDTKTVWAPSKIHKGKRAKAGAGRNKFLSLMNHFYHGAVINNLRRRAREVGALGS